MIIVLKLILSLILLYCSLIRQSKSSLCVSFANEDDTEDYNETKKSIDSYIDNQLGKIDLEEIQKYIKVTLSLLLSCLQTQA